jgi:hypothetical protein
VANHFNDAFKIKPTDFLKIEKLSRLKQKNLVFDW